MNKILFFVICAVYCLLTGCADENLYINNRLMMGTMVEVISPEPKASEIVFQEIKRVEGLFSKYDSQSQIFRLNKYGESKVSAEVLYLLNEAGRFYKLSAGAFDITVGPLLKVWGFTDKKYRIPDSAQIKEALALVGYEKIILDEDNFVVKFEVPGMTLDLGGLAKGYAVDSAVRELKEAGVKSCLINAGGDIYCLGNKSGKPWRVGVRQPGSNRIREYVRLRDKAIATSGNY
ncbi:MAG: FAD:protein FMN transferase, partial [Candidatus Omnitrophica bacterium]|nr:FAD:protein FMN transferase [Candidatus Omnitrophota bacterium]